MTTELVRATELQAAHQPLARCPRPGGWRSRLWKTAVFFWKYLVGSLLCLSLLGSLLVVGWTYRLSQRVVLKQWWKRSGLRREGIGWQDFVASSPTTAEHQDWPNWLLGQRLPPAGDVGQPRPRGLLAALRGGSARLAGSLAANAKLGGQALFNTWVLTLPACVLWLFAWHAGWNNSFHKGYEQAAVGPLTGLLGVALFIAAMLYVPLAQMRQAATGCWQSFYQFGLVWRLIRQNWLGCLLLAALYAALALPVHLLKTAPAFFLQINPALEQASDTELRKLLGTYFFWCCAVVLPSFVLLRLAAARLYARTLLAALRRGTVLLNELAPLERETLERLRLHQPAAPSQHSAMARYLSGTACCLGQTALIALTALIWFVFVAQIFVSEFLNYHPFVGWMNQPLVQLPWFRYLPPHLQDL